ncbi:class III lanthipeptide [Bacillus sp. JCM 19041]
MNKVLSLQKETISRDVQLKARSLLSFNCKTSSNASIFIC